MAEVMTTSEVLKKLVFYGQRFLVYPSAFLPRPRHLDDPSSYGLASRDIEVTTSDNVVLRCFLITYTPSEPSSKLSSKTNEITTDAPAGVSTSSIEPEPSITVSNAAPNPTANVKTNVSPLTMSTAINTRTRKRRISAHLSRSYTTNDNSEGPQATVIMFHGNGMDHSDLLYHAKKHCEYGCNVFTVSYRGYGNSDGLPSEKGLQRDAQAALDFVWNDPGLGNLPIIIYGLSLGGAVAIDVTSKNPEKIAALILENTFTSIPDIVHTWPVIGHLSFICTQRWNSASKIPKIPSTLPILFCSGRNDFVVPPQQMDRLCDIGKERGRGNGKAGERGVGCSASLGMMKWTLGSRGGLAEKVNDGVVVDEDMEKEQWHPPSEDVFVEIPDGGHDDTSIQPKYWVEVEKFVRGILSLVATPTETAASSS